MNSDNQRVCSAKIAGSLDNKIRRLLQNPRKILKPYVKEGMTVLDIGCGPGFFTVELARLVGESGTVIAADLQEGMLVKLKSKIDGTEMEKRIILHKCSKDKMGVSQQVDFTLAFYMVHEVPDKQRFFIELQSISKDDGPLFIIEPKFHVSEKSFANTLSIAEKIGYKTVTTPSVFFSRAVILKKY